MNTENSLSFSPPIYAKQTFKSPLIPSIISRVMLVFFALSVSTSVLLLLEVPFTTSDQNCNYPLFFMASLTFFLAMTLLPLLLTMNSPKPVNPISARLVRYLTKAILFASFTTLILAFPYLSMAFTNLNELTNWRVGWAIQSGLIFFAIAMLHKSINKTFPTCHLKCLNVSFLTLCIAFSSLYTDPLCYLPGTTTYNSIIHRTDRIYHSILVPVTFVLGTILLIVGVAPTPPDLVLPFVSGISKEGLTVSTLAVGLITLLIGVSLMSSVALANFAMAGGFRAGGPGGIIGVGVM